MKKSIRILTIALALLAISSQMFAQTHQVVGRVLDASNGEPVIGAGVVASNGGGTVTDYDGNYVLSVSSDATLTFSSIG
ncbi:MAG: carboxypeptidase-like regulatory domain-containing protein [Bacteroidales bacterium]|nr:carboxypeptidase-like regulatory domain-containing protein [Bacteroidales bacterium]